MLSLPSGRPSGESKPLKFAADDVHGAYDYDHTFGAEASKLPVSMEFQETMLGKSLVDSDINPEEEPGYQDVIAAVGRNMKKYTDSVMNYLEGISGRMSQLELFCCDLENTIGELRSDFTSDHVDTIKKLNLIEKHIQEVHRSVQILRDKQELLDAQKDLTKLQLSQQESSTARQTKEDNVALSVPETCKSETSSEAHNSQLHLPLHQQPTVTIPRPPPSSLPQQQTAGGPNQPGAYYPQQNQAPHQVPGQSAQIRHPHPNPHLPFVSQSSQVLDPPLREPPVKQPVASPYAPYQQQWPQPVQRSQPLPHVPTRFQMPPVYPPPPYHPQNGNFSSGLFPSSMPMQVPLSTGQPQPQPSSGQGGCGPQAEGFGYEPTELHHSRSSNLGYMTYDNGAAPSLHSSSRGHSGGYLHQLPPSNAAEAQPSSPLKMRGTPYCELMEEAISMGIPGEQVATALRGMEENGLPIDLNTLLERLNAVPLGAW